MFNLSGLMQARDNAKQIFEAASLAADTASKFSAQQRSEADDATSIFSQCKYIGDGDIAKAEELLSSLNFEMSNTQDETVKKELSTKAENQAKEVSELRNLAKAYADAQTKMQKEVKEADDAQKEYEIAQQKCDASKKDYDTAVTEYDNAVKANEAEEAQKAEEAKKAEEEAKDNGKVRTSGTTTTRSADGKVLTENSQEFKAQEKENIETAKNIREEFKEKNSLARENSQIEGMDSARTLQRKGLANVEVVPGLVTNPIDATIFEDSVSSGNNAGSAATSTVRNKSEAVNLYLKANGVEPTGYDAKGNPRYSAPDIYAAEYAVSALQEPIVNNAKEAEAYQQAFLNGTATAEQKNEAINYLQNGRTFPAGDENFAKEVFRKVGDGGQTFEDRSLLLNNRERDALIDKIKSGSQDFTQRELNALTYLQGTTDNQGFPTVPSEMQWNLPSSMQYYEGGFPKGTGETEVFNFRSNGTHGNDVKVFADKDSDEFKVFSGLSHQVTAKITGAQTTGNSQRTKDFGMTDQYNKGDVTWQDLWRLGIQENNNGKYQEITTVTPAQLLKAGMISEEVYNSLSEEGKNKKIEIRDNNNGIGRVAYSAKSLTDGDFNTGRANETNKVIANAKRTEIAQNGGYSISDGNAYGWTSNGTSDFISYYEPDKHGNPQLTKHVFTANDNIQSWIDKAQRNYQRFVAENKL